MWVSYCSKGQVRRDLESVGWVTQKLPGPPGKREMMRAKKPD
jgi:tRNA U34 5-methylaminomethyl-2-thiouridine-forming methyltransferase MnmC